MPDDGALFDSALELALGGDTFDLVMTKYAAAVERGDCEWVRFLDERLRLAVAFGNHAVVAEREKRNQN